MFPIFLKSNQFFYDSIKWLKNKWFVCQTRSEGCQHIPMFYIWSFVLARIVKKDWLKFSHRSELKYWKHRLPPTIWKYANVVQYTCPNWYDLLKKSVSIRENVQIRENLTILKHIIHISVFIVKINFTINEFYFTVANS